MIFLYYVSRIILKIYRYHFKSYADNVSYEQLYYYLQHGDIVNTSWYQDDYLWEDALLFVNTGLSHFFVVIEEDGVKYMIHTHDINYPITDQSMVIKREIGQLTNDLKIIKEPLRHYLHINRKSMYYIYRNNKSKPLYVSKNINQYINPYYHYKNKGKMFYCTLLVADILIKNGKIPSSHHIYPFHPEELIYYLVSNGYNCTTLLY